MAKFHGMIGYAQTEETSPGVYTDAITERDCAGDILRNSQVWENARRMGEMSINDNISISNRFSIIGNAFAYENLQKMRYLKFMGAKWKISSIEILSPRIILTVGGVYNG